MAARKRVGIVLFQLGGPDSLEAVEPFLLNLFRDPDIIPLGPLGFLRRAAFRRSPDAPPLFQAAQSGGVRKMRIERQQDNFIEPFGCSQRCRGFVGQRMPVTHRRHRYYVNEGRHRLHQLPALPFR